jgi:hypothetical protein
MIKHDHENELLKQSLKKTNLNLIFQITFHISRQNAKHVINVYSQVIRFSIYRNSESLLKSHQVVQKKRLLREKKFIIVMFSKKGNS